MPKKCNVHLEDVGMPINRRGNIWPGSLGARQVPAVSQHSIDLRGSAGLESDDRYKPCLLPSSGPLVPRSAVGLTQSLGFRDDPALMCQAKGFDVPLLAHLLGIPYSVPQIPTVNCVLSIFC